MPSEGDPKTIYGLALRWARNQPFQNVVTTLLLIEIGAVGYGLWLFATVEHPKHLNQIREMILEEAESHERVVDRLITTWNADRAIDREHTRELIGLIRETAKSQEEAGDGRTGDTTGGSSRLGPERGGGC